MYGKQICMHIIYIIHRSALYIRRFRLFVCVGRFKMKVVHFF